MGNRERKLSALTTNFHEFMNRKKKDYRIAHLFMNEKEIKFLKTFNFVNVEKREAYDVLEVIYEGFEYVICVYTTRNRVFVASKNPNIMDDIFIEKDSKALLYDYLEASGTILALKEISSKPVIGNLL